MDYIEANAWLKGERSMSNSYDHANESSAVLCAKEDAAMCERAYWVARAKNEKLTF